MHKPESGRLLQAKTTQVICLRELAADLPAIRINKIGDCPYFSHFSIFYGRSEAGATGAQEAQGLESLGFDLAHCARARYGCAGGFFLNTSFQSTRPVAIMITSSVRIATITIERPV